ncbi:hypothetical protein PN497_00890 [Sphaerospermopsis kisseleviana CS-549]|jgi:hypothetical protein|nr:hypothetical protein [Sphaerospermopsis kisseleviana]MDB9439943.1 hypothetical protein [Sphaerospermopsis kisseleviana CS-549]BAZ80901.1 hypothetical protein NIES73_21670 [Sphaerospermopsis kisseleviana NIES-73]
MFSDPDPVEKIAVALFWKLVKDENLRKQIYQAGLGCFDFIQVATNNVNLRSPEEDIKIALRTCIRNDTDSKARITAFVTGLHLQHKIQRGAQVGGSLLRRFGKSYFPHINDRELRFALDVDSELENYLYNQIIAQNS